MIKYVVVFLLFASLSFACPEKYSKELKVEKDSIGWTLKWFDIDCDDKCDAAVLFSPTGEPYAVMTCEQGDELHRLVQEENAKRQPKKSTLKYEDI